MLLDTPPSLGQIKLFSHLLQIQLFAKYGDMAKYSPFLTWLHGQKEAMVGLVEKWANINSGSSNLDGLARMATCLKQDFQVLGADVSEIPLPNTTGINSHGDKIEVKHGCNLLFQKRRNAPLRIFLGGHMDTVYGADSPFQKTSRPDPHTLKGPGVVDMKGGLVILLKALECLERSPFAEKIGWEVLINSDEEIGSMASEPLFRECAKRNQLGLIFEPAFPDGALVSARKGAMNYTIVCRGKAAHVGRDFHLGKNAVTGLARLLLKIEDLNLQKGIILNVGSIFGGGPSNIVPDLAVAKINIRIENREQGAFIKNHLEKLAKEANQNKGVSFYLHQGAERPPKPFDAKQQVLFEKFASCAKELGTEIRWKPTGGVCDGNLLAAEGLPVIDTLGAIGGNMHTHEEFLSIDSLVQRATLTACFLMQLAEGNI